MSRSLKVATAVTIAMAGLLFVTLQRGRTLRADRSLRELPGTTRAMLSVDAKALGRTGAAQILFQAFVAEDQLSEIEEICGFDPLTALSEATLWVRGPEDQPFQSIGLMLRGRTVNAEAIADCHQLLVEARGASIVRLEGPAGPLLASQDRRSAVALIDERSIVTGSVRTVAEAIAVRRGAVPSLLERPRMAALWRQLRGGAGISAVLDLPANWKSAFERVAKLGGAESAMEGVQAIALSVAPGSEELVYLYIDVAEAAVAARDADLIAAWCASPPDSVGPDWAEVLTTARVELRGRTIRMTFDVASLAKTQ